MQATFKVKEEKLPQLQELVKAHDLRFVRNPQIYSGNATVTLDGDHLPQEACNEFFQIWDRLNTPIREVPKATNYQQFMRKLKKSFG